MSACLKDEEILDFARGTMPPGVQRTAEAHVSGCAKCRARVDGLEYEADTSIPATAAGGGPPADVEVSEPLGRGEMIGPYIVGEALARGGMGVVYAATHSELNRRVALKVVRPEVFEGDAGAGQQRLLREAQAMAQLSHPNVVTVFDAGTVGDKVFLAMELVEGETLSDWLRDKKRDWHERVAAFVAAGRGLAAAHRAGIIHRDFKPANVLVGKDGSIRVTDFGLARATEVVSELSTLDESTGSGPRQSLRFPSMTVAGSVMGTPGYMAPEQAAGKTVDARSDQFSFFAAVWQGLYGELPYPGTTLEEIRVSAEFGRLRALPPSTPVPERVRRVMARGLAAHPGDRFPTLDDGLRALEQASLPVAKRYRPAMLGTAAMALTALMAFLVIRASRPTVAPGCEETTDPLAGVWDSARHSEITTRFLASSRPYAGDALRAATGSVDAYAARWKELHRVACAVASARAVESQERGQLQLACLRHRLRELNGLVVALAAASDTMVEQAPQAARNLSDLDGCEANAVQTGQMVPPSDKGVRTSIDEVRGRLADVRSLDLVGRYADELSLAERTQQDAAKTGWAPLQGEAAFELGRAYAASKNWKLALEWYLDAAVNAESARVDRTAAEAWIEHSRTSSMASRFDLAHESNRLAEAAITRLGGDDGLSGRRELALGAILADEGAFREAITHYKTALTLTGRRFGANSPEVAPIMSLEGAALTEVGDYDPAIAVTQTAIDIRRAALGPAHPLVADSLMWQAHAYEDKGDFAAALDRSQQAIAIDEKALGPDHPRLGGPLTNEGNALEYLGRFDEALRVYRRAMAIHEKSDGKVSAPVATVLYNMGDLFIDAGQFDNALDYLKQAIAMREKLLGTSHPHYGMALGETAGVYCRLKRYAEAGTLAERALAIAQHSGNPEGAMVAEALTWQGCAQLGRHQTRAAIDSLENAYKPFGKPIAPPVERARVEVLLARALLESGGDRSRATQLIADARGAFVAAGNSSAKELTELDACTKSIKGRTPKTK